MRIVIFPSRIDLPNADEMLRVTKENEWWHNHETALSHDHTPDLIKSNLQAATFGAASYYSRQLKSHIVIKRITNHRENHNQKQAFSRQVCQIGEKLREPVEPSPAPPLTLLPILDMTYIELSKSRNCEGSNSSYGTGKSRESNENLTHHLKHESELREFFKLNQLGLQIEHNTEPCVSKLHIKSKSSKSLVDEWGLKQGRLEGYGYKDGTSEKSTELERQKQAVKSETCCRLASINEAEELTKHSSDSSSTYRNNDSERVDIRKHHTGVMESGSDQELAIVTCMPNQECNTVEVRTELGEMKHQNQARDKKQQQEQQQQQRRVEMRCGCRRQVSAINASTPTPVSTSAATAARFATKVLGVTTTTTTTTTTTATKTGLQVEARLKALRPSQPAKKQVAVAEQANLEATDQAAAKQRQQVFCCMLHSTLSSPSSSLSSSSIAPFSSLSPRLASSPFERSYHCESSRVTKKSTFFTEINSLNKSIEGKHENCVGRGKSVLRSNKQQRNVATRSNNKTAVETICKQSLIRFSQPARKNCQSLQHCQENLIQTSEVGDPLSSSILCCNKPSSYLNYKHNGTVSQDNHLPRQRSKIEQEQQRDTSLKRNFAIRELRSVKRPRRRKRPVYVEIKGQIERQEIAKKRQKESSLLSLEHNQKTTATATATATATTKPTNKLVTPNLKQIATNNNSVIFGDNLKNDDNNENNDNSKGVITNCTLYKNNKSRAQNLIMQSRSPSSSSSSPSSSSSMSSSSSVSFVNHRYNNKISSESIIISNNRERRPLLGEGGLLTDRLMRFPSGQPLVVASESRTSSPAQNNSSLSRDQKQRQRSGLKTITEINPNPNPNPNSSSSTSSSSNHNQNNISKRDYIIANDSNNNLHPLEVLDQQSRMSISIYDPLPKPGSVNEETVIQSKEFHSSVSNHSSSGFKETCKCSTLQLGMHPVTGRRRQLDKRKDSSYLSHVHLDSETSKQVSCLANDNLNSRVCKLDVVDKYDENGQSVVDDEEERLRNSFPLELRRPIIDLPVPKRKLEVPQRQLESPTSPPQSTTTEDNILFVTIELGANQTRPLRMNPGWNFEELVENVHSELLELQREIPTNMIKSTTNKRKKTTRTLYEEARELAKLFKASLTASTSSSSTRKDVGGFVDSKNYHYNRQDQYNNNNNHHQDVPIDPTAISLSDRARMVGQAGERRNCFENEAPCWEKNEDWRYKQHGYEAKYGAIQNEERKLVGSERNLNRQFRVLNRDFGRNARGSENYNQSGATEPPHSKLYPCPHQNLPLPLPLPSTATAHKQPFSDWRQNLRRTQNRSVWNNDRHLGNITHANVDTKSEGKTFVSTKVEPQIETGVVDKQANYLQSELSNSSNVFQCKQRKCSCGSTNDMTTARVARTNPPMQAHDNSRHSASVNLKKVPDRSMMVMERKMMMMDSTNEDNRATTSQNCSSNSFVVANTNSNNGRHIDYTTTMTITGKLGNAFSHVVRHDDKSQINRSSSNNDDNDHLQRQDNHSAVASRESLNRDIATETNFDSNLKEQNPDMIQRAAADTTKNNNNKQQDQIQTTSCASGDSKKYQSFEQQQTMKRVISQPLSYARTVLANEANNRVPTANLKGTNDNNRSDNNMEYNNNGRKQPIYDTSSPMKVSPEQARSKRHVGARCSDSGAAFSPVDGSNSKTIECKQPKVDKSQLICENGNQSSNCRNESRSEKELVESETNVDPNPNEKLNPPNKEKSGSSESVRMTLESTTSQLSCQEERKQSFTPPVGEVDDVDERVATNAATNIYSTTLALPPTPTVSTSSLLEHQVGIASTNSAWCAVVQSETASPANITTLTSGGGAAAAAAAAAAAVRSKTTQTSAVAITQKKQASTLSVLLNQQPDESICSDGGCVDNNSLLYAGQQAQVSCKVEGDDNDQQEQPEQRLSAVVVSEPAPESNVHGNDLDSNSDNFKDAGRESRVSPQTGCSKERQQLLSMRRPPNSELKQERQLTGDQDEEAGSGQRESNIAHARWSMVQRRQQQQQQQADSEETVSSQEEFKRKVVLVTRAKIVDNGKSTNTDGGKANSAAAAKSNGCATMVKVFCSALPANESNQACLAQKETKPRELSRIEVDKKKEAEIEVKAEQEPRVECATGKDEAQFNSWAAGKSQQQFAGITSPGDKGNASGGVGGSGSGSGSGSRSSLKWEEEGQWRLRIEEQQLSRLLPKQQQQQLKEKEKFTSESTEDIGKAGKVNWQVDLCLSAKSATGSTGGSELEATKVDSVAAPAIATLRKQVSSGWREQAAEAVSVKSDSGGNSAVEQRSRSQSRTWIRTQNKPALAKGIAGETTMTMNMDLDCYSDDDDDDAENKSPTEIETETERDRDRDEEREERETEAVKRDSTLASLVSAQAVSGFEAKVEATHRVFATASASSTSLSTSTSTSTTDATDATTNTTTSNTCITDCKTSEGRSQAPFLFSQRQQHQVNSSNGDGNSNNNNSSSSSSSNSNSNNTSSNKDSNTTDFSERTSNSNGNSGKRYRNNSIISAASLVGTTTAAAATATALTTTTTSTINYCNNDISPSQAPSSSPSSASLTETATTTTAQKSSLPSSGKLSQQQPLSFALIVAQNNGNNDNKFIDRDVKFVLDKNNNNQQHLADNNYAIDSKATSSSGSDKLNIVACSTKLNKLAANTTTATATTVSGATEAAETETATAGAVARGTSKKKKQKAKRKDFKTGSYQKQSVKEAEVAVSKQKIKTEEVDAKAKAKAGAIASEVAKAGAEAEAEDEQEGEETQVEAQELKQAQTQTQAAEANAVESEAEAGAGAKEARFEAQAATTTTTKTNDNNPYCNNIQADIFKRPNINHSHNNTNYYLNNVATNSASQTTNSLQQPTQNITSFDAEASSSATTTSFIKTAKNIDENLSNITKSDTNYKEQINIQKINTKTNSSNVYNKRQQPQSLSNSNSCYHCLSNVNENQSGTTSNKPKDNNFSSEFNSYSSDNSKEAITTKKNKLIRNKQDLKEDNSRDKNSLDRDFVNINLTSCNNSDRNSINLSSSSLPHLNNNSPKMTKSLTASEDTQTSSVKKFVSNNNNDSVDHQDTIYEDRGAPIKQHITNNNNNNANSKRIVVAKNQSLLQQSTTHSPSNIKTTTTTTLSSTNTTGNKMRPNESDPVKVDDSPLKKATSNSTQQHQQPSTTNDSTTSSASVNKTTTTATDEHTVIVDSDIKQPIKHHQNSSTSNFNNNNNDKDSKMSSNEGASKSNSRNSNKETDSSRSSPTNGISRNGQQAATVQTSTSTTINNEFQQQPTTSSTPNRTTSSSILNDSSPPKQQQQQSQQPQQQSQDANQNQQSAAETMTVDNKQRVPSQPPANNRSILIIREIDPKSPESSVRDIFNSENCPSKPVHCDYALHNSWYVTFKDDEDAKLALAYIRKYIVTWNGQPIMARIKPKPAVPSATNQPPPNIVPPMVMQAATTGQQQLQQISQQPTQQQQHVIEDGAPETGVTIGTSSVAVAVSANHHQLIAGQPRAASVGVLGASAVTPMSMNPAAISATSSASPTAADIGYMRDPSQNHPIMHHLGPQMVPHAHHHHHHHHHHQPMPGPHHYGYSAVAFYGQHGPILTPWHYSNAPQYDLSEVFIYNGLTPFPTTTIKSPTTSNTSNTNSKMITGGGVSSAALLGGSDHMTTAVPYHHRHHHNNHQNSNQLSNTNQLSNPVVYGTTSGAHGGGGPTIIKGANKSNHQRNDNHKNNLNDYKSNTPTIGSSNGASLGNNNHHHSNSHHHNQHHHQQQQHLSNQTTSSSQPNVNGGGSKRNRNNPVSNRNNNNGNSYNTAQQQASTNSNVQQSLPDIEHLPGRPNRLS